MMCIFDLCQTNNGLFCECRYTVQHYQPVIHLKKEKRKWRRFSKLRIRFYMQITIPVGQTTLLWNSGIISTTFNYICIILLVFINHNKRYSIQYRDGCIADDLCFLARYHKLWFKQYESYSMIHTPYWWIFDLMLDNFGPKSFSSP